MGIFAEHRLERVSKHYGEWDNSNPSHIASYNLHTAHVSIHAPFIELDSGRADFIVHVPFSNLCFKHHILLGLEPHR
jgi:hypothetical protein